MDWKIKWTEIASSDIEAIVRYLQRRDLDAARKVGKGIYSRAQELLENPMLGSIELSLSSREWRKLIYLRWKIIYTLEDGFIVIGRVWPCAMNEIDFETPLES